MDDYNRISGNWSEVSFRSGSINNVIENFEHNEDFSTVVADSRVHNLGLKQAKVIKQLYIASKADSPWVCGKKLLYEADSNLIRIRDLFKYHSGWECLIESDLRGSYRLNLKLK